MEPLSKHHWGMEVYQRRHTGRTPIILASESLVSRNPALREWIDRRFFRIPASGQEFLNRHCKALRNVASSFGEAAPLGYVVSANSATTVWPSSLDLYEMDVCILRLQHEVFSDVRFANLPTGHTFTRPPKVGPQSCALAPSGTQIAGAKEFCMSGEPGVLGTPFAGSSYGVSELSERRITTVAARLGPQARGDATNCPQKAEATPPAMRRF